MLELYLLDVFVCARATFKLISVEREFPQSVLICFYLYGSSIARFCRLSWGRAARCPSENAYVLCNTQSLFVLMLTVVTSRRRPWANVGRFHET
eukprot:5937729-Amphidinium_carterae.1